MRFGYLKDSLFIATAVAYVLNRCILKPTLDVEFLHYWLNDLICIPFLVPIMLFLARRLRLRDHDDAPHAHEIVIPLIVWSLLFECVYPRDPFWQQWVTGDPHDVLAYAIGAFGAMAFWQWRYRIRVCSTTES